MTKQTDQATTQPITLPTGFALEDLAAAVSRGVREALAAHHDVSGYAAGFTPVAVVLTTVIPCPPAPPQDPRGPLGRIVEQGVLKAT